MNDQPSMIACIQHQLGLWLGLIRPKSLCIAFGNSDTVYQGIQSRTGIQLAYDPRQKYVDVCDDIVFFIHKSNVLTKAMVFDALNYFQVKKTVLSFIGAIIVYTPTAEASLKPFLADVVPSALCISPDLVYEEPEPESEESEALLGTKTLLHPFDNPNKKLLFEVNLLRDTVEHYRLQYYLTLKPHIELITYVTCLAKEDRHIFIRNLFNQAKAPSSPSYYIKIQTWLDTIKEVSDELHNHYKLCRRPYLGERQGLFKNNRTQVRREEEGNHMVVFDSAGPPSAKHVYHILFTADIPSIRRLSEGTFKESKMVDPNHTCDGLKTVLVRDGNHM
jgi:hypothetical protein